MDFEKFQTIEVSLAKLYELIDRLVSFLKVFYTSINKIPVLIPKTGKPPHATHKLIIAYA